MPNASLEPSFKGYFSEAIVDFQFKRLPRTDVLCPIEC
jgi:hypothetical protein